MTRVSQEQTIQNLQKILAINRKLNSTLDLDELLGIIMTTASEVMQSDVASLMLVDEASNELVFRVALGEKGDELREKFRIKMGEGIAGTVAKTGEPLIINDAENDSRVAKRFDDSTGFTTKAMICVPMKIKSKTIGVLQAINPSDQGAFEVEDLHLFEAFANQAAVAVESAKLHNEILQQAKLQQTLEAARSIQQSFLPDLEKEPFQIDLFAKNIPALGVSGDFYDVLALCDGKVGVLIGDVSGKGMGASLYMVKTISEFRFLAPSSADTAELMTRLNARLVSDATMGMFVTLSYVLVDIKNKSIEWTSAGHHPILLLENSSEIVSLDAATGPPAGLMAGIVYETSSRSYEPGTYFALYSDGITEARNLKGDEFGSAGLEDKLKNGGDDAKKVGESIMAGVASFAAGAPQHDDMTLIVAKL